MLTIVKIVVRYIDSFQLLLSSFFLYGQGLQSVQKGVLMTDHFFEMYASAGWFPGTVTPSGLALLLILAIMGTFSHRMVRRSGRFEVTTTSPTRRNKIIEFYLFIYFV